MASTQLLRTQETPTSTNKYTWSAWIKRGTITNGQVLVYNYLDSNNRGYVMLEAADRLFFYDKQGGSEQNNVYSTRVFRDTNAWYHIHIKADSTQANESDRFQVHINGVRETLSGSGSGTIISQNDTLGFAGASGCLVALGSNADSVANCFDGIMSHVYYVDGLAIAHTEFGSTDSTTGEWKINTSPTISEYGNSGYLMLKDDNSLNDDSGKGNNFTASGTLTKTEDCPNNVFATLDPLSPQNYTFSNGNNTIYRAGSTGQSTALATLAPSSGKYYWEVKLNSGQSDYPRIGIYEMNSDNHTYTNYLGQQGGGTGKWWGAGTSQTGIIGNGTDSTTAFFSYSNGDILMFAMDNDNGKLWLGKNGTWYTNDNSTTTTGTAIGNNTATPAFSNVTVGKNWTPAVFGNASGETWQCNFGNGYFGTTQISSEGTNASNIGKFEYDVPPNFTAISTKGLNE